MNYLQLALKVGPWLIGGILALLLSNAYAKVSGLEAEVKAGVTMIAAKNDRIADYAAAVASRDAILKQQSSSIDALAAAAQVNRASYEAGLTAAAKAAGTQRDAASALLALVAPPGELEQCRAARGLLEKELVN